jgi:hypothetical protein
MNQTEKAYESSGKSIYSADLRLFILENELNLVKKYLRELIGYEGQIVDYVSKMLNNQKLLEWAFIYDN